MSTWPWAEELRSLPSLPGTLRFTALYGTNADAATRHRRRAGGQAVGELFAVSSDRPSYREWMLAAADQLPAILDERRLTGDAVNLDAAADLLRVDACWTWTIDIGEAGFVLAVAIDVTLAPQADASLALSALFEDFDTHRRSRRIAEAPLEAASGLELGFDFHAVIALPEAERTRLTAEAVQGLVSRQWHLSLPRFVTASLNGFTAGFPDGIVAVTPGASVVCGIGDDGAMAAVICAAQAISALATLRHFQQEAYRAAVGVARATEVTDSRTLETTIRELAEQELDLSLAVERFAEMRLFIPVWRLEQYHKLLLDALGIERATAVTASMLGRVSASVTVRLAAVANQRSREAERHWRSISAVGGAVAFVAIPLTIMLAFLGIGVSPVGPTGSVVSVKLLPYYIALLSFLGVAAGAAWLYIRRNSRG